MHLMMSWRVNCLYVLYVLEPPQYLCERVSYDDEYESYIAFVVEYMVLPQEDFYFVGKSYRILSLYKWTAWAERNVINVRKEGGKLNCDDWVAW